MFYQTIYLYIYIYMSKREKEEINLFHVTIIPAKATIKTHELKIDDIDI